MLQYETGFSFTLFTFGALALAQQSEACHEKYNLYLIQHTNKSLTIFETADCSVGAWPGIFCMYGMKFMKTAAKNYDNSRTTVPLSLWVLDCLSLRGIRESIHQSCPLGLFMVMLIRCWLRWVNCCPIVSHLLSTLHHHHHWAHHHHSLHRFSICHSCVFK